MVMRVRSTAAARSSDTVERIRRTALRLFTEHGYERTSLREIADALGFTKAALYYHFRSKEDLLTAVLEPLLTDIEELVGQAAGRDEFLDGYLEVMLRHRALLRYLISDAAAVINSDLAPRLLAMRTGALEVIGGAAPSLTERMRSSAALGALQSAIVVVEDGEDEAQVRATALAIVHHCLAE